MPSQAAPEAGRAAAADGGRARSPGLPWRALATALLLSGGCGAPEPGPSPGPDPWLVDVTAASGLDFRHLRGRETRYWFPEIMGAGVAWADYDGDGDLDAYLVQSGELQPGGEPPPGNRLFRNEGGRFHDVTGAAGAGDTRYGMGVAVGDADADGRLDLYLTNVGANVLLRNRGDGRFEDVTDHAGVGDPGWGTSAAFLDADGDGRLDLFVANYVSWSAATEVECYSGDRERDYCGPTRYKAPGGDVLYRNLGGGRFREVSAETGLDAVFGTALGVLPADFDQDGHTDLFVANDGMPNQLWRNRGDGTFQDEGLLAGVALNVAGEPEASMGVAAPDLDGDGDLDLFLTHLGGETNTFYRNLGGGLFEDVTASTGLLVPSFVPTGFGVGFVDFDHDGALDLYVANGRVSRARPPPRAEDPFAEANQLFRGDGGILLQEIPAGATPDLLENSRGAAFGDYDGDGDVDVLVSQNQGRARLLENRVGGRGHWVQVLPTSASGAPVPGVMVGIAGQGRVLWRRADPAYSYCSSNDPRAHAGLGRMSRVEALQVLEPGGRRRRFLDLPVDRVYVLAPAPSG